MIIYKNTIHKMNTIFFLFKMFIIFSKLFWKSTVVECGRHWRSVIIIVCNWLNVFSRANNKNVDIILSASAESTGLLTQAGVWGATQGGAVRVVVITSVTRRRSHALAYHYTEYFPSHLSQTHPVHSSCSNSIQTCSSSWWLARRSCCTSRRRCLRYAGSCRHTGRSSSEGRMLKSNPALLAMWLPWRSSLREPCSLSWQARRSCCTCPRKAWLWWGGRWLGLTPLKFHTVCQIFNS